MAVALVLGVFAAIVHDAQDQRALVSDLNGASVYMQPDFIEVSGNRPAQ